MADLEWILELPDLPVPAFVQVPDPDPVSVLVDLPELPVLDMPEPVSTDLVVLPVPGPSGSAGGVFEHVQLTPATTWTIDHGLGRRLVSAQVFSLDYGTQWDGVLVQPLDADTVRLSFDDPTSGVALIL